MGYIREWKKWYLKLLYFNHFNCIFVYFFFDLSEIFWFKLEVIFNKFYKVSDRLPDKIYFPFEICFIDCGTGNVLRKNGGDFEVVTSFFNL